MEWVHCSMVFIHGFIPFILHCFIPSITPCASTAAMPTISTICRTLAPIEGCAWFFSPSNIGTDDVHIGGMRQQVVRQYSQPTGWEDQGIGSFSPSLEKG